jgi:hypothetical protein
MELGSRLLQTLRPHRGTLGIDGLFTVARASCFCSLGVATIRLQNSYFVGYFVLKLDTLPGLKLAIR